MEFIGIKSLEKQKYLGNQTRIPISFKQNNIIRIENRASLKWNELASETK